MKLVVIASLVAAVLAAPGLQKREPGEVWKKVHGVFSYLLYFFVAASNSLTKDIEWFQVLLCTEPNFEGTCEKVDFTVNYPNACRPIPEPFRNNLGSIRPDRGALCRLTT